METKNFASMLNELNSSLNLNSTVNGVYSKKYDYSAMGLNKSQEKSKRVELRKLCNKIYYSKVELSEVLKFVETMQKSLIVCTQNKKSFYQLSASEIFSNYEKLDAENKKIVDEKHKLFVEICTPVSIEKPIEKPIKPKK